MGIGRTLANILKEKNIKVTDLARNINVAPTTLYSIIDRDNMTIDISILIKICNYLMIDINSFYKDCLNNNKEKNLLTAEEINLLNMFRNIDDYGKKAVNLILKVEYARCKEESKKIPKSKNKTTSNSNQQNIQNIKEELPPPIYHQCTILDSNCKPKIIYLTDEQFKDLINSPDLPSDL